MADKVLLAPTNGAAQSNEFVVKEGHPKTVYLYPIADLTAGENANLQRKDAAGTWGVVSDPTFKGSGGQIIMDTIVTDITVTGEGVYRIDLENPTNSIGVGIADQQQE